jgi:hypothetical protein
LRTEQVELEQSTREDILTDVQRDIAAAAPNSLPNSGYSKLLPMKLRRWALSKCRSSGDDAAMTRNAFAMTEALKDVAARCREEAEHVFLQIEDCSLVIAKIRKTCTQLKERIAVPHRDISPIGRESRFERLDSSWAFCRIENKSSDSTTANYPHMPATERHPNFHEVVNPPQLSNWAQCAQ